MKHIWPLLFSTFVATQLIAQRASLYENTSLNSRPKYDSLWYWHPFSVDLFIGSRIPLGQLSVYQKPGVTFAGALGVMIMPRFRISFVVSGHWSKPRNPITLNVDGNLNTTYLSGGGSFGGSLSYIFYQDRFVCTELLTCISRDGNGTKLANPNPKNKYDSLISIPSWGLTLGLVTWLNSFDGLNLAIKTIYSYSNIGSSVLLQDPIGGHSATIGLIFRIGRRGEKNKRFN